MLQLKRKQLWKSFVLASAQTHEFCKAQAAVNSNVECSYITHLIWCHLNWLHFIRTEGAALGRSHGKPGRYAAHDRPNSQRMRPVTTHSARMKWGQLGWDEVRWDKRYERRAIASDQPSGTRHRRQLLLLLLRAMTSLLCRWRHPCR